MQFLIMGRDGADSEAPGRRQNARAAHLKHTDNHRGHVVTAAALLDDQGNMNGSVMILEFPDRDELDEWLRTEPYVVQGVWVDVTVTPCRLAPAFVRAD